jgi:type II secretory pathway component PulJ
MEVTIAMLLAAIVIGITYTCYSIIYKSYVAFKARQTELVEVSQFTQVLRNDMTHGDIVLQRTDGIVIKNKDSEITYNILPEYSLRISTVTDTFKIKTEEVTRYFEGLPLTGQQDTDEQNRIDELSFTILSRDQKFPYYYFKQYSSQNLINRNPNAIN